MTGIAPRHEELLAAMGADPTDFDKNFEADAWFDEHRARGFGVEYWRHDEGYEVDQMPPLRCRTGSGTGAAENKAACIAHWPSVKYAMLRIWAMAGQRCGHDDHGWWQGSSISPP